MPKTKISEFDTNPDNNTDINSINIAEGCPPSGINNAIRQLMADLKEFQTGAGGDPFNGAVNGTVGATTPNTGAFTTLSASGNVTLSGGTANGVAYLNGSKVLTTGSTLTYNGTILTVGGSDTTVFGAKGATKGIRFDFDSTKSTIFGVDSTFFGSYQPIDIGGSYVTFNTSGSEQIRLTSTGLGIGTSSPAQKLDVVGNIRFGNTTSQPFLILNNTSVGSWKSELSFQNGSSAKWAMGVDINASGNNNFYWYDAAVGTERMRLDSSGNLGIGTSSPQARFHIFSSSAEAVIGRFQSSGSTAAYIGFAGSGASTTYDVACGAAGTNIFAIKTADTERMRIDSSGNVGIGTSSMPSKLTLEGTNGAVSSQIQLVGSGVLSGYIGPSSAGLNFGTDSGGLIFRTGVTGNGSVTTGTERMRIDSSGNLLVGTTNTSSTAGTGLKITAGSSQSDSLSIVTGATSNAGLTTYQLYSTGAGAYRFYVGAGGTVFATSTTISAISDVRFKENVRDLDVGLVEVMALKPRLYDWKEGKGADIKDARGFIAQEFEQVFPDLIDEWRDPAPEGEEPYKSVRQDLIPVLVKAIQEQQAIINDLTNRITQLENK